MNEHTRKYYCSYIDDVLPWNTFYDNNGDTNFCVIDRFNTIWFPVFMIGQYGQPTSFIAWNNTPMLKPLLETLFQE